MLFLAVAILAVCVFSFYMCRDIRKQLIVPMEYLTEEMQKIGEGDYEHRIETQEGYREFYTLVQTFNRMMNQIVHLKIRNYEEKLALSEANQKYVRLQLRPHFFLNAMATVSSLSKSGKNQEIETYIKALSKNIRYMFSSGFHTVSIKEEVRHVENYLEMQELKFSDCVFCYIELPDELGEWRVPQMLLHTLVENEYRYAITPGETRMLLIRISTEMRENEKMLKIEVEDDGQGYPGEVLAYINGNGEKKAEEGSRVGLWSIRQMLFLMYGREGLFQIGNVEPHGAYNCIYIPEKVLHEIQIEDI